MHTGPNIIGRHLEISDLTHCWILGHNLYVNTFSIDFPSETETQPDSRKQPQNFNQWNETSSPGDFPIVRSRNTTMIFTNFIFMYQCLNVLHSSETVFVEAMTQKYSNSWAVQLQPFADNELELHSLALTLGLTHRKVRSSVKTKRMKFGMSATCTFV